MRVASEKLVLSLGSRRSRRRPGVQTFKLYVISKIVKRIAQGMDAGMSLPKKHRGTGPQARPSYCG